MLSKILVGIDGSEYSNKAFEYAISLSSRCKSDLLIVNVLEEYGNVGYSISKELEQQSKELLETYRRRAEKSNLSSSLSTIQLRGISAAGQILGLADSKGVDTIVIGSRGPHEVKEFLLGSTTYKIVHNAKCTVVIAK
ncbi:MAG TPA: universal stress protein [Nitrososphaeraceae archaeon]|jgi:nucleotide-binding universal stress UspA family protein